MIPHEDQIGWTIQKMYVSFTSTNLLQERLFSLLNSLKSRTLDRWIDGWMNNNVIENGQARSSFIRENENYLKVSAVRDNILITIARLEVYGNNGKCS